MYELTAAIKALGESQVNPYLRCSECVKLPLKIVIES